MKRPARIEERFDKLPKWAQYYIEKLEKDLESAYSTIERMSASTDDQAITWHHRFDDIHGLPPCSIVSFRLTEASGAIVDCSRRQVDDTTFILYVQTRGWPLSIRPGASNVVEIAVGRY